MTSNLHVESVSKKYHRSWVFRDLSFTLSEGQSIILTGPNGSGKSTLLRILAGRESPTQGKVTLTLQGRQVPRDEWYRHLSWAGPWLDLYPDLTLAEMAKLHFSLRTCLLPGGAAGVIEALSLGQHSDKPLRVFSSGMLHRVKVGFALFSDSSLLLLDEATANLDPENAAFIFQLIREYQKERMLIFATNAADEFDRFGTRLHLG
jgi:ABC-type multidrug transport system ATPase subunit